MRFNKSATWHWLAKNLHLMSEKDVTKRLDEEMREHRRASVLIRLHQRYTKLRAQRERSELLKLAEKP